MFVVYCSFCIGKNAKKNKLASIRATGANNEKEKEKESNNMAKEKEKGEAQYWTSVASLRNEQLKEQQYKNQSM